VSERRAWNGERDAERGELVTACSCTASRREADARRERYPRALAEDMEGFGVALACALERVPLRIVRGASNIAGDRDARAWRIDDALAAASELARALLERDEPWLPPRPEDEA
jgi:futalosine hydrolase